MSYGYTSDITTGGVSNRTRNYENDFDETSINLEAELASRMDGSLYGMTVYASRDLAGAQNLFTRYNLGGAWAAYVAGAQTWEWVACKFPRPVQIEEVRILPYKVRWAWIYRFNNFSIEASNDSTNGSDGTWITLAAGQTNDGLYHWQSYPFVNNNEYLWYRLSGLTMWTGSQWLMMMTGIEWIGNPPLATSAPTQYDPITRDPYASLQADAVALVNYQGSMQIALTGGLTQYQNILARHLEEVRQMVDDSDNNARCALSICSATCGLDCSAACTTGCGLGCSWGCNDANCDGACDTGCTGSCRTGCSGDCQANCAISCQGGGCGGTCLGKCGSGCGTSCSGDCRNNYVCAGDCQGSCTGGCGHGCSGNCSGSCTGGCAGGCSSTCAGTCGEGCNVGCWVECSSTCGDNVCAANCGISCAQNACYATCQSGCLWNCYNTCNTGCGNTGCTTTARIATDPGF